VVCVSALLGHGSSLTVDSAASLAGNGRATKGNVVGTSKRTFVIFARRSDLRKPSAVAGNVAPGVQTI
jgi:hypothetical protein